jgi:hypothetical protein
LFLSTKVPSGTLAVVLNVTATEGTIRSYLTVWPTGQPKNLSNLNFESGTAVANLVTAAIATGGKVCGSSTPPVRSMSLLTSLATTCLARGLSGRPDRHVPPVRQELPVQQVPLGLLALTEQ